MPYAKRKPRSKKRVYRKRPQRTTRVTPNLKRYVKKEIHRNIENKEYTSYAINQPITIGISGSVVPFQINLLPEIAQGTGVSNRIGDAIQPVYGIIRGQVNLLPFNEVTNPFNNVVVKMFLVKWKSQTNPGATIGDTNLNNFFQAGPNDSVGFQGNMLDMMLPINASEWTLYATRKFKLGVGQVSASATYGRQGTPADNSSYCKNFTIKYIPNVLKQKLTFNDIATARPKNTNLRLFVQVVNTDGSAGTGITPVEIHYTHTFKWEDA